MVGASSIRRRRAVVLGALGAALVAALASTASRITARRRPAPKPATRGRLEGARRKGQAGGQRHHLLGRQNPADLASWLPPSRRSTGSRSPSTGTSTTSCSRRSTPRSRPARRSRTSGSRPRSSTSSARSSNGWVVDAGRPELLQQAVRPQDVDVRQGVDQSATRCSARPGTRRPYKGTITASRTSRARPSRARSACPIRACRRRSWTGTSGPRRSTGRTSSRSWPRRTRRSTRRPCR